MEVGPTSVSHTGSAATGDAAYNCAFFWCGVCGAWKSRFEMVSDTHFAGHTQIVNRILLAEGYLGCSTGGHDDSSSALHLLLSMMRPVRIRLDFTPSSPRTTTFTTSTDMLRNLTMKCSCAVLVPSVLIVSSPTCSDSTLVNKEQLISHLEEIHAIKARLKKRALQPKAGKEKASKEDEGDHEDEEEMAKKGSPFKKRRLGIQRVLAPKGTNDTVGAAMKDATRESSKDQSG